MGALFTILRLIAGGLFERLLKALSAIFDWFASDWRNFPLVAFFVAFQILAWISLPEARSERDAALADAEDNLTGWIAERAAHGQSIDNIKDASAEALAEAKANAARVQAEERAINERALHDYQANLRALRARYDELDGLRRGRTAADLRAGPGGADPAGLPGARTDPVRVAEAARDPGLPQPATGVSCPVDRICLTLNQAWTASVQALQLDALIALIREREQVEYAPQGAGNAE